MVKLLFLDYRERINVRKALHHIYFQKVHKETYDQVTSFKNQKLSFCLKEQKMYEEEKKIMDQLYQLKLKKIETEKLIRDFKKTNLKLTKQKKQVQDQSSLDKLMDQLKITINLIFLFPVKK